jgi:hypothetical protein
MQKMQNILKRITGIRQGEMKRKKTSKSDRMRKEINMQLISELDLHWREEMWALLSVTRHLILILVVTCSLTSIDCLFYDRKYFHKRFLSGYVEVAEVAMTARQNSNFPCAWRSHVAINLSSLPHNSSGLVEYGFRDLLQGVSQRHRPQTPWPRCSLKSLKPSQGS